VRLRKASRGLGTAAVSAHAELHRPGLSALPSSGAVHRSAATGSCCLPGPSRAPPVSTPNRTCAATWPGAPSAAWIRWPPSGRTWSCTSGGCRRSAGSGPPPYPGGSRSRPGSTGPACWTASCRIRPPSTCAALRYLPADSVPLAGGGRMAVERRRVGCTARSYIPLWWYGPFPCSLPPSEVDRRRGALGRVLFRRSLPEQGLRVSSHPALQ
jgi:hypothetical protein